MLVGDEQVMASSCLATSAYMGQHFPRSLISAYDKAVLRQMRAPMPQTRDQYFSENHIKYVLEFLRDTKSAFLTACPVAWITRRLGWPSFKLFREGCMPPISHLYRHGALMKRFGVERSLWPPTVMRCSGSHPYLNKLWDHGPT